MLHVEPRVLPGALVQQEPRDLETASHFAAVLAEAGENCAGVREALLEDARDALVHVYSLVPSGTQDDGQLGAGPAGFSKAVVGEMACAEVNEEEKQRIATIEKTLAMEGWHAPADAHLLSDTASLDAARCLCGIINDAALSLRPEVLALAGLRTQRKDVQRAVILRLAALSRNPAMVGRIVAGPALRVLTAAVVPPSPDAPSSRKTAPASQHAEAASLVKVSAAMTGRGDGECEPRHSVVEDAEGEMMRCDALLGLASLCGVAELRVELLRHRILEPVVASLVGGDVGEDLRQAGSVRARRERQGLLSHGQPQCNALAIVSELALVTVSLCQLEFVLMQHEAVGTIEGGVETGVDGSGDRRGELEGVCAVVVAGWWEAGVTGPVVVVGAAGLERATGWGEGDVVLLSAAQTSRGAAVSAIRACQAGGAAAVVMHVGATPTPFPLLQHLPRDYRDIVIPVLVVPREETLRLQALVPAAPSQAKPPPVRAMPKSSSASALSRESASTSHGTSSHLDPAPPLEAPAANPIARMPPTTATSSSIAAAAAAAAAVAAAAAGVGGAAGGVGGGVGGGKPEENDGGAEKDLAVVSAGTAVSRTSLLCRLAVPIDCRQELVTRVTPLVRRMLDDAPGHAGETGVVDAGDGKRAQDREELLEGQGDVEQRQTACQKRTYRQQLAHVLRLLGGSPAFARTLSSRGVRVLAMDGGGIRGLVLVEMLRKIEADSGRRITDLFDVICGTSAGGLLAMALLLGRSLVEIEEQFWRISSIVFRKGWFTTAQQLTYTGSKYDARVLEDLMLDQYGGGELLDTPERPRCFMVSTLASIVPAQPFVWRNYSYPPGHTSRYPGTCTADVITALRATSAAPSYFDDIVFENGRHLDGGCIANNPAAIALHEARCLFPGQPLACLVSLATGSPAPSAQAGGGVGWQGVLSTVIHSASSVTRVADCLADTLPADVYYRCSPEGAPFEVEIDQTDKAKIEELQGATHEYIRQQHALFASLSATLCPD